MSEWPAAKAGRVLAALLRIGWSVARQRGSHRRLVRAGWAPAWASDARQDWQGHRAPDRQTSNFATVCGDRGPSYSNLTVSQKIEPAANPFLVSEAHET